MSEQVPERLKELEARVKALESLLADAWGYEDCWHPSVLEKELLAQRGRLRAVSENLAKALARLNQLEDVAKALVDIQTQDKPQHN